MERVVVRVEEGLRGWFGVEGEEKFVVVVKDWSCACARHGSDLEGRERRERVMFLEMN